MIIWYITVVIYLLSWLVLLVHCLKRKRFYPVLGAGWGTKLLWLATFFLFSPPLTVLYILFGALIKPRDYHKQLKPVRPVSLLVIILIVVIIVTLEMPGWKDHAKPKVFSKDSKESSNFEIKTELQAGKLNASNNFSTATSSSHSAHNRFAARTIVFNTFGTDELLDRVSENLAESLSALAYIEKVKYFPEGTESPKGSLAPDVTIFLSMPKKKEQNTPVGRKLDAIFNMAVTNTPYKGSSGIYNGHLSPPVIQYEMQATLDHESTMTGYESRQAKYKQQAENISAQLFETIKKQFKKWIDDHGLVPELPGLFYGNYTPPAEFEFLKQKNARMFMSNYGLMNNNHTIWIYDDLRPTQTCIDEVYEYFNSAGWRGSNYKMQSKTDDSAHLRLSKGRESIYFFRQKEIDPETGRTIYRRPDQPAEIPNTPFVLHYERCFDEDQLAAVKEYLLEPEIDIDTLFLFSEHLNPDKLADLLQKKDSLNFDAHLHLAKYYQRHKQPEKAKNALLYARALARTDKEHNPKIQEIEKLAKKLGNEKLAKLTIGEEIFKNLGFIDANSLDEPYEVEKKLGECVAFYIVKNDREIRTLTYRVTKDESGFYSVESIEKEGSFSSVGHNSGTGNVDNWMTNRNFGGIEQTVNLEIRLTPEGNFKYKAHKI